MEAPWTPVVLFTAVHQLGAQSLIDHRFSESRIKLVGLPPPSPKLYVLFSYLRGYLTCVPRHCSINQLTVTETVWDNEQEEPRKTCKTDCAYLSHQVAERQKGGVIVLILERAGRAES